MAKNLHVVPHDEGWAIKQEGEQNAISAYSSQDEAIHRAEELARQRELDVIIHRQDGTFEHVETFSNDNAKRIGAGSAGSVPTGRPDPRIDSREVLLQDVVSVGSRVSWGALMAGAVIALTLYIALGTLGVAVNLSTASTSVQGETLSIIAAIWAALSLLVSLFLGGFVTSRSTVGENRAEAMSYGLLLWGTLFIAVLVLANLGLNIGMGGIFQQAYRPVTVASSFDETTLRDAGLTDQQIATLRDAETTQTLQVNATSAAWWTFGTLIVSIIAAVAGSLLGAGPSISLEFLRDRRLAATETRHATVQPH